MRMLLSDIEEQCIKAIRPILWLSLPLLLTLLLLVVVVVVNIY